MIIPIYVDYFLIYDTQKKPSIDLKMFLKPNGICSI